SVTLTLTTTGNRGCPPSDDQMIIIFTDPPQVDAGPDQEICANNSEAQLNASTINADGAMWSGGNGLFLPDPYALDAVYIPTQEEIDNGFVILTISTIGAGNCLPVTDQLRLDFTPGPEILASDVTVCANNAEAQLSATVQVATGVTWSGGNGVFSSPNSLNTNYTPTTQEITNGSVNLTVTSTGNGDCLPVSEQITLTITPEPLVNAGDDRTVCANNATVTLNGSVQIATGGVWSGGNGQFSDPNSLTSTYTLSQGEIDNGSVSLTLTSTGNDDCLPVTDQMTINVTQAPIVDPGPNVTVCGNNPSVTLQGTVENAGGGRWSGGDGTYTPNQESLTIIYTPSPLEIQNNVAFLFLTSTDNGNCLFDRESVYISIQPAPEANAGPDVTVCANNATVSLNGSVEIASSSLWTSSGTGSFTDASEAVTSYIPSEEDIENGTVTLTLTAFRDPCNPISNDKIVTILPAPIVDAGPDFPGCGIAVEVPLNGTVENAGGGIWSGGNGNYTPGSDNLEATYVPTQAELDAGTLVLTLTSTDNGLCLPVSDQKMIWLVPPPQAEAGPDQTVCANNSQVSLDGSVIGAGGGRWIGGSGTFIPDRNSLNTQYTPTMAEITAGSVVLTLRSTGNGDCPPSEDQMTINITPAPIVNAGPDRNVCADNPTANLSGLVTNAGGGTWSGGQGTFGNINNPITTYTPSAQEISNGFVILTLTSTNNGNCLPVRDNMQITIRPVPVVDAGPDQVVCGIETQVELNGYISNAGGASWSSSGNGTFDNTTSLTTIYHSTTEDVANEEIIITLISTSTGICTPRTDNMTIRFTPAPEINAGSGKIVCTNSFPVQLEGSGTSGTWSGGGGIFSPGPGALNARYTPSQDEIDDGSFTLTLTTNATALCPPISDDVTITIPPGPVADAGPDQNVCGTESITLSDPSVTNASGGTWTSNGTGILTNQNTLTPTYTPSEDDIISERVILTLTTTGVHADCPPVQDQMIINITPPVHLNAGTTQTICADIAEPINLNGTVNNASSLTWSTTEGSGLITNANSINATYTLSEPDRSLNSIEFTLTTDPTGACGSESQNFTLNINPAPTVSVTPVWPVCSTTGTINLSGSFTNTSGATWSSTGTGAIADRTIQNTSYSVSQTDINNGSVTFRYTTNPIGSCDVYQDEFTLTIVPESRLTPGPDQTLCSNNLQTINLNGTVTGAPGAVWSHNGNSTLSDPASLTSSYTPNTDDANAGQVIFTLTSDDNAPCPVVTRQMQLNFTPSPEITPGPDRTICADANGVSLSASVDGASGLAWSHNGHGSLSSSTSFSPVYSLAPLDRDENEILFTISSTGNGNCLPVSETLTLTIVPRPTVHPGDETEICADALPLQLQGTSSTGSGRWTTTDGSGIFSPDPTDLNGQFFPSQIQINNGFVTIRLTSTNNGLCQPVSALVTHDVYASPYVNAGPNQTVCASVNNVSLSGEVNGTINYTWTTSGDGIIHSPTNLNSLYTPGINDLDNGVVTLTLTATLPGCAPRSDIVRIFFETAPTADAGNPMEACINDAGINLSGSFSNANGAFWTSPTGGNFFPGPTNMNSTYNFTQQDKNNLSVTLTLTTSSSATSVCPPASSTVTINITPEIPTVNAGPTTMCTDETAISLAGQVNHASGGVWSTSGSGTFSPNESDLNAEYIPSIPDRNNGTVTLTLETTGNGGCAPVTDHIILHITPGPSVTTDPDQIICADVTTVNINGTITPAGGGGTAVAWTSSGGGAFSPQNATSSTYRPSAIDFSRGYAYLVLTSTDNGSCLPATDTLELTITPRPRINAGPDRFICVDDATIDLQGSIQAVATGGAWSAPAGTGTFSNHSANGLNATFIPSASQMVSGNEVILTLTSTGNGDCNPVSDQMKVTVTPPPTVDTGDDFTFCTDVVAIRLSAETTHSSGGVWSSTGTGQFSDLNSPNSRYIFSTTDRVPGNSIVFTYT
ncbi:MAG: hypothetical protein ACK4ND_17295, partial [Cytophagaceae bacterium]